VIILFIVMDIRTSDILANITVACRAVSRQRLCKHVPAGTDTNATMVQQERNGVSCVVLPKGYKRDGVSSLVNEDKRVVIAKIVLNLMEENGH
jgi:hypothetical protein